jgi:polyhydroxybutyrate depolymerase
VSNAPHRAIFCIVITLAACSGDGQSPPARVIGGARPVTLQVPPHLEEGRRYPLALILHGYGADGFVQQAYFGLSNLATRGDAFVLAPDGTVDSGGKQFWNADSVCCDFDHKNPDDVGYLGGLVDEVIAEWPIDPSAVFSIGHSNGGFMSYRLACDRADLFSAILSLAGDAVQVPCAPAHPVSVLHVHGTADDTVPFAGAGSSVGEWATRDGCGATRAPGPSLDLDTGISGAETATAATAGCPAGVAVDLWTIAGGGHIPVFGSTFAAEAWRWLTDHRRP